RRLDPTPVEKLAMVARDSRDPLFPAEKVARLIRAAQDMDRAGVYDCLMELGIGFQPRPDRPAVTSTIESS
ncbi:MAG TPA: hypothetical protein VKU44_02500, partial [Terriglobia bacterium]|nr:hypothetical protein [Terriglobia bacterium]